MDNEIREAIVWIGIMEQSALHKEVRARKTALAALRYVQWFAKESPTYWELEGKRQFAEFGGK